MKYLTLAILIVLLASCGKNKKLESADENLKNKEILIYCENVMVPPLMELKGKFEEVNHCKIKLHNDCSQNLASLIQYSLEGDIYIPASHDGFLKLQQRAESFIVDSVYLGTNPLVVMALKGNPSGFSGDLTELADKKYAVIIANPETSSLGSETRKILDKANIYDDVILNVVALSTDSRGLVKSLENDEAQLVINWNSDLFNNGNKDEVEVFPIAQSTEFPTEIYAGILSTSKNKDLARAFLTFATEQEGINVFRKYGFSRRKSLIF